MPKSYEAVVIGGGIVGRLTAWFLAKSGKHTLLLEQHLINTPLGSSKGNSRLFGESFEDNIYFKFARQSRELWRNLECETGLKLLSLTGGLDLVVAPDAKSRIKKIASILKSRNSEFEVLNTTNLNKHYPQWRFDKNTHAIFSPESGVLRSDRCMNAAIVGGKKYSLEIRENSHVAGIELFGPGLLLIRILGKKTIYTKKLVIAAGPWMPNILKRLGVQLPLRLSQEQSVYFVPCRNRESFNSENFPVWEFEGKNFVYGLPIFESSGIKIAFHQDGRCLKNLREFSNKPSEEVINRLRRFLDIHIPDASGEVSDATTCLYTNTSDGDFVIDTIPHIPQIAYFTGCNGHAFHCAPAIAKTLVELVTEGKTSLDISRFSSRRMALVGL